MILCQFPSKCRNEFHSLFNIRNLKPPGNLVLEDSIRVVFVRHAPDILNIFLPIAFQWVLYTIRVVEVDVLIVRIDHLCIAVHLLGDGLAETAKKISVCVIIPGIVEEEF